MRFRVSLDVRLGDDPPEPEPLPAESDVELNALVERAEPGQPGVIGFRAGSG